MKRQELSTEERLNFLEQIVTTLFGYRGNVKVDWKQDFMGYPKVTLRNVQLNDDGLENMLNLSNHFDLEVESRAIVSKGDRIIPNAGPEDADWRHIYTEEDLVITSNYEQWLIDNPNECERVQKQISTKWTEEDNTKSNHVNIDLKTGEWYSPEYYIFADTKESIEKRIEEYQEECEKLKEKLIKLAEEST